MGKENGESQFWKVIDRFRIIIQIIGTITTISGTVWAAIILIQKGLQATIPAWTLLIGSLFTFVLGIVTGRRSNPRIRNKKKDEAFNAVWETDQTIEDVDGPFCKTCLTRMEPYQKESDIDGSKHLEFTCKNPGCEKCGAVTRGLAVQNIEDAKRRASEYFIGQKRKNNMTKSK